MFSIHCQSPPHSASPLEIRLPDTDIVKLNVTLRASSALEPTYRTHKTEVCFDNLPDAVIELVLELTHRGILPLQTLVAKPRLEVEIVEFKIMNSYTASLNISLHDK